MINVLFCNNDGKIARCSVFMQVCYYWGDDPRYAKGMPNLPSLGWFGTGLKIIPDNGVKLMAK
jgi:hypothetical protein